MYQPEVNCLLPSTERSLQLFLEAVKIRFYELLRGMRRFFSGHQGEARPFRLPCDPLPASTLLFQKNCVNGLDAMTQANTVFSYG